MSNFYYYFVRARNLCRQIACFRIPPPTAGEIETYKLSPVALSWAARVFHDSSKTNEPERSSKKKQTWLRRCESSAACQEKTARPSRSVAASIVVDPVAVTAAVTSLIIAVDTSTVFPFSFEYDLLVGCILMTISHFISSWVRPFCRCSPFDCQFSDF